MNYLSSNIAAYCFIRFHVYDLQKLMSSFSSEEVQNIIFGLSKLEIKIKVILEKNGPPADAEHNFFGVGLGSLS